MGCMNSTQSDADKAREFRRLVASGNPLAVALDKHWNNFVKEENFRAESKKVSYEAARKLRRSRVVVNSSEQDARRGGLTYEKAQDVANFFLGYAMTTIADHKWGGSVKYNLKGAAGRESFLSVTSSVTVQDSKRNKFTDPYNVEMSFYLC